MHDAGTRDAGRSEDLSKSNWVAYHWRENNDPLQSREMKFLFVFLGFEAIAAFRSVALSLL